MNFNLIQKLSNLADLYKLDSKLKFKLAAINKALVYINVYPLPIISGTYAKQHLPSIGDGIAKRIDEIITTGTLSELTQLSNNNIFDAIADLTRITGLGEIRAKKLIKQDINTVNEYKKAIEEGRVKSTHHIDIGLKYFDDLQQRIPRQEIEQMEIILRKELTKLSSHLIFNICGSYRRDKITCGDIDILITNRDTHDDIHYLPKYVNNLTKIGFIVDHLTYKGEKKYMGVCKLYNLGRRIDLRFVEYAAYYAALIYFTGSKNFNIQIRNKAIDLGYSLNEYGLTQKKTKKLICLHSEEEIFNLLKLDYVKPSDRDV